MIRKNNHSQIVAALLRKIQASEDFPAFGEHISKLQEVVDDDETSLRQITNVILRDVSLTMKMLRTANAIHYNRSGKTIVTVTHAVALLGLDAVRDLSGGIMLFQKFWGNSPNQKRLLQLSMLTACQARATAARMEFPPIEEAYLCGMFRNLGEILVSGYMPRKYAAILQRMKDASANERGASLRVLECTFEELGQAATRDWKMPDRVRQCMQPERTQMNRTIFGEMDILRAITSFSHGLTETIHRANPSEVRDRLEYLLMSYGSALSLDRDAIQEIASEAVEETRSTFDMLHIPLDDLTLRKQTEIAMATLEAERAVAAENPDAFEPGEELLERLTEEVELILCTDVNCDVNRVLMMILEAIHRGASFNRTVFALTAPDHRSVHGRLGLGENIDELLNKFHFPLSIRSGPVAIALLGKQDSFISDARYANTPFGQVVESGNFGLMPVIVHDVPVGIFYFDRNAEEPPPSDETIYQLSRLRSLAAEVIQTSQDGMGEAAQVSG